MIARCVAAVMFVVFVIAPLVVSVFDKLENVFKTLGN